MQRTLRSLTVVLVLLAALFTPAVAAAAKCPADARCGSIDVPIDRAGNVPGTFPIAYATLPATGPRAGTIFFLAGGPGESAIIYTTEIKRLLEPIRGTHDIVLVDQRGTGRSGETDCLSALAEGEKLGEGCAKRLGDRRAFLTTKETARDLDDLRVALGVDKIIPLGVSYGTKVAGEYARRFPERTAAVVLDSPVGMGPIDLMFLEGISVAPRVLREACAAGPCARTLEDAGATLVRVVARLGTRGLRTPKATARHTGTTRVLEGDVLHTLLQGDGDAVLRADLPAALASLANGDTAPFVHLEDRVNFRGGEAGDPATENDTVFSASRYLATACLEAQLPWAPDSAPGSRAAAERAWLQQLGPRPFAPFRPSLVVNGSIADLCKTWPATTPAERVPDPGPDVPVLVLSGRADLRTPLELATRVAATYPRATLLDVPHVGHSVLAADPSGCAVRGLRAFLTGAAAARCMAAPKLPASPYLPVSPRGLGAAAIARYTVEGVLRDSEANRSAFTRRGTYGIEGLRGGRSFVSPTRIWLREVSWFKGVTVSGTVTRKGKGRVTVRGIGGPARTVRL